MKKTIKDFLSLSVNSEVIGDENKLIESITADSRNVKNNSLFVCLKGLHFDGHNYLFQAKEKGAVAAIVEEIPKNYPEDLTLILVPDTRKAAECMVPYFYDYPGKKMRMIGVTGTNGKTTTTNIIRTILRKAGFKVGLIGTINIMIEDECIVAHNTTPDIIDLQNFLYDMVMAGCDYVVMEVSSHALALDRVSGCEFDVAVLTNITQDHLDFHKNIDSYRDAKSILFESLALGNKKNKTAIFNMDDPSSKIIEKRTKANTLSYGESNAYDIYPLSFNIEAKNMYLHLNTPKGELKLNLKITGEFNVYNVMAAVAVALSENIELPIIETVLNGFDGVPGRFQLVEAGQPYTVIVDYAHTPDGLENVLNTARLITKGKLWVVFGCGGDRDNKKRPIMGALALKLADNIVVTSDNPRTEDPELIIKEIITGFDDNLSNKQITTITDRKAAIYYALENAENDDVILIAGKGHENYQSLADKTIHFDDREVVQEF